MKTTTMLGLLAIMATAGVVQSCAKPSGQLIERSSVPHSFLREAGGWALSTPQSGLHDNSALRVQAMFGAGGGTPFGCGLSAVRSGYFSGTRGKLTCAISATNGHLTLKNIQRASSFARIYDAVPIQNGFLVVAQPVGHQTASAIFLDSNGEVQSTAILPGSAPDQAIILTSGRIALLRNEGASCNWTILERDNADYTAIATTSADQSLCYLSHNNGELLRDQTSGQAYLRSRRPEPNALYRIDDNGSRSPSTLVASDFNAHVIAGSSANTNYVTIYNEAVYFDLATERGPIVGRYDLKTGQTTTTDFRVPSGNEDDPERVYGFAIAKAYGSSLGVALMTRSGATRVVVLDR